MERETGNRRTSKIGTVKRTVAGTLIALTLVGSSVAGTAAEAGSSPTAGSAGTGYTETTGTTTDDGTIVFVCTYDDVTGELLFCDVYFYPRNSAQAAEEGGRTTVTIDDSVNDLVRGNDLATPQRATAAPGNLGATVDDRKGDKDKHGKNGRAGKGKKGKQGGKGRK